VIDFREKSPPEQLAQFAGIDRVSLRPVKEKPVLERIADDDPVDVIEEFKIEPVHESGFFESKDDAAS
jgi:hypothetical protein